MVLPISNKTFISDERDFLFIRKINRNLIVAWLNIYDAQQLEPFDGIHKLIYHEKRKVVIWASLVEVGDIMTQIFKV